MIAVERKLAQWKVPNPISCRILNVPSCHGRDSVTAVMSRVKTSIGVTRNAYCVHAAMATMAAGHARLRASRARRDALAATESMGEELAEWTMRSAYFRSFWLRRSATRISPGYRATDACHQTISGCLNVHSRMLRRVA